MQIQCRNCGAPAQLPDYHGPLLVKCSVCSWQELLPARRRLPKDLDKRAGEAFAAQQEKRKELERKFENICRLSTHDFEHLCAELFERLGYEVAVADPVADQSHALEMRWEDHTVFVACHHNPVRPGVEREEIENLAGSMRHAGVAKGMIVTTGSFAEPCVELANEAGIELMDGVALQRSLESADSELVDTWSERGEERAAETGERGFPLTTEPGTPADSPEAEKPGTLTDSPGGLPLE